MLGALITTLYNCFNVLCRICIADVNNPVRPIIRANEGTQKNPECAIFRIGCSRRLSLAFQTKGLVTNLTNFDNRLILLMGNIMIHPIVSIALAALKINLRILDHWSTQRWTLTVMRIAVAWGFPQCFIMSLNSWRYPHKAQI